MGKGKDIIERLKRRQLWDGTRVTFFLSQHRYERFKELCSPIGTSAVIDDLIKGVLEDYGVDLVELDECARNKFQVGKKKKG